MRGLLYIQNKTAQRINQESFYPRNWVDGAERIETDGRDSVWRFVTTDKRGRKVVIFAKSPRVFKTFYYDHAQPPYFLSPFAQVNLHKSSAVELEHLLRLRKFGVLTEQPLGYFERGWEQYLFTLGAKGDIPTHFFDDPNHKSNILQQDSRMLAGFCLAGLRKAFFDSWDDKLYDGHRLRLIDADEVDEIEIEFRTSNSGRLILPERWADVYRKREIGYRVAWLRDVIKKYHAMKILGGEDDMKAYAQNFFTGLGYSPRQVIALARNIHVDIDNWLTKEELYGMMTEE